MYGLCIGREDVTEKRSEVKERLENEKEILIIH